MEQANEVDRMVTVREIADIMGYSLQTVRRLIKNGAFPRVHRPILDGKLGHSRIFLSDFENWREENTYSFEETVYEEEE
jgi:excisionase family DNA binding protein